ncbi:MAG TPA: DUF790 family protein, partial [Planctomycetota bacterium]|nr:DUF790 family protein [Planctomycetota bacterium]
ESNTNILNIATTLIQTYKEYIGKSREELQDTLKELLGESKELIIYRGFSHLLESYCTFVTETNLDPSEIRQIVFKLSSEMHKQGTFVKQTVLQQVAMQYNTTPEKIEKALFQDLKQNEILESFEEPTPQQLIKKYNTSLAQGILYKALSLEIDIKEKNQNRYRQLFRSIKFFRLLPTITEDGDNGYHIHLDGPMTLFQSSTKYGLQLALFLPALLLCDNWSLTAPLQWKQNKQAEFKLSSKEKLYSHYADQGMYQPPEILVFQERFQSLQSEWVIQSEPNILTVHGQVIIPDYMFVHFDKNMIVYLEIFGYWRNIDLDKRLQQLSTMPYNFLLAVSKKYNVDNQEQKIPSHTRLYTFKQVLQPKEILKKLNQFIKKK